ncbi:MAG: DUF1328 domain-containing protein [Nitrospirales bacterium]|nr:hypothetical protein [Nitrospirales bacterium]
MLTIGFILLVIAGILAMLGFGLVSSPAVGPVRIAFYFVLIFSLSLLAYGIVQEEQHADPKVPIQAQN